MDKQKQLMILTGAGFTKNFDGFLATEMWSKIFHDSRIRQNDKLKRLLQRSQDYEFVYHEVLKNFEYSEIEKDFIKEVLENAYKKLDDSVRGWLFNSSNQTTGLDLYKLYRELLGLINRNNQGSGLFFTLNQDLFIERKWGWRSPGIPMFNRDSSATREFESTDYVKLPSVGIEEIVRRDFLENDINYIKLHGSFGWRSSDGSNRMVIGKDKESDIEKEPLLKEYFKLFKDSIKEGDRRLLIIGYGFGDPHINKVLLDGINDNNLKLYIISTQTPENLKNKLEGQPSDNSTLWERSENYKIWEAVEGYFPNSLKEIFPPNQSGSVHIKDIKDVILN